MRPKSHHYILIFLLIQLCINLDGQIGVGYGTMGTAIGTNSLTESSPSLASGINPAAIVGPMEGWSGGIGAQRLYSSELSNLNLAITRTFRRSGIGFQVGSYGIKGFKRSQLSAAYAMRLNNKITLGTQANVYQLNIQDLGNQSSINTSLGLRHMVSKTFTYSLGANNLLGNQNQSGILRYFQLEVRYNVSDIFTLYNATFIVPGDTISLRPGILYHAYEALSLNVAFDTANRTFAFGVNIKSGKALGFQAGLRSHQQLGSSLAISATYDLNLGH